MSEQSGPGGGHEPGPAWWPSAQPWKPTGASGQLRSVADHHGKNVSVTTINVPPPTILDMHDGKSVCKYMGGQNGVTVSVVSAPSISSSSSSSSLSATVQAAAADSNSLLGDEPDGDSDGEVSRIDFRGVNLRTKKKRDGIDSGSENACGSSEQAHQQPERPMSWEGELSDQEMSSNTITAQDHEESSMEGMQVCSSSPGPQDLKFPIKPEPDFRSSPSLHQQQQLNETNQQSELPLLVDKLLGGCNSSTPSHSPVLMSRHHLTKHSHTRSQVPSPDSAIHSAYSVFSSPTQSPHAARHSALGPGSPVPSGSASLSLSRHSFNNSSSSLSLSLASHSLSRNNSDASSSCYSYGSISPPTHSPVAQQRHIHHPHHLQHLQQQHFGGPGASQQQQLDIGGVEQHLIVDGDQDDLCRIPSAPSSGISTRQQLINSPCPICGDKISGFHYGIFSCESCKGFFKRTVQNRKNYVCLREAGCPVTVATRKKCPACRFDKCLNMGMKLEAIREDRTRGGRSTYQCTYTLPANLMGGGGGSGGLTPEKMGHHHHHHHHHHQGPGSPAPPGSHNGEHHHSAKHHSHKMQLVPQLLQDIMDVEHLWHYNDNDRMGPSSQAIDSLNLAQSSPSSVMDSSPSGNNGGGESPNRSADAQNGNGRPELSTTPGPSLDVQIDSPPPPPIPTSAPPSIDNNNSNTGSGTVSSASPSAPSVNSSNGNGTTSGTNSSSSASQHPDFLSNLCNIADHRLYKIVKWCKSLPLFKNISIDDQICLLINSWCELLLFSCCFRSMSTPGEIRVSLGKSITLEQARQLGLATCIERMLAFTNNLRRLRVDQYEYVAMKVIVLLTSDTSELKEPEKVRASQEKALQALQQYTIARYPEMPAKFGELLLRIPDLQRTCQVGKELLSAKRAEGEGCSFNLLMELLRGDH
ncbi:hypothetical protein QAD02_003922 [Eretmocerus hayati]|uniref:Uncharacterized protein n=1 Tax=Eretmocerus hayati TaxID=131215 RepID=A0ACC2NPA9_9HYME|nr:hypothetical protein QAD02_003922 [Eretmocerus hayati]